MPTLQNTVIMQLRLPYHLPHNSIRVDEFEFMLKSIDCSKLYYTYEELRLHFLKKEMQEDVFRFYHSIPHNNLLNHSNKAIRKLYKQANENPETCSELLSSKLNKYTLKKSFKQLT